MGRFPRLTPVRLGLQVPDLYDGFTIAEEPSQIPTPPVSKGKGKLPAPPPKRHSTTPSTPSSNPTPARLPVRAPTPKTVPTAAPQPAIQPAAPALAPAPQPPPGPPNPLAAAPMAQA